MRLSDPDDRTGNGEVSKNGSSMDGATGERERELKEVR
jgi:hypothetical protein